MLIKVRPVADFAALLADPAQVTALDPEEARALLSRATALAFALAVRAAAAPPAHPHADGDSTRNDHGDAPLWLSVSQVEAQYGLSATWLSEHAREMEKVPGLVSKPSRKVKLYRAATLRRWIESKGLA